MRSLLTFFSLLAIMTTVSAQCIIGPIHTTSQGCKSNGTFDITFDFDHVGVSDSFRVQGNGINHGVFAYGDLPITIDGLEGNCVTSWEFVVRDLANPSCSNFTDFGVVCCNESCEIAIIDFNVSACNNDTYDLSFGVEGYSAVYVRINGDSLGLYSTDSLPLVFEDVRSFNNDKNTLVVCDQLNSACCDTILFDSPCSCSLQDLRFRIVDCNQGDSTYQMLIDFTPNQTSDSFNIGGNNTFLGTHAYRDLPLQVGPVPFHADPTFYFLVDKRNSFCFNEYDVPAVTACDTACSMSINSAEILPCDEGTFYVALDIMANNPGLNGFRVRGNGRIYDDSLQFAASPYLIGPLEGDCHTIYEFVAVDHTFESCRDDIALDEVVCCRDCELADFRYEVDCKDGLADALVLNFRPLYTTDSIFDVEINGKFYGSFVHLPITIDIDDTDANILRVVIESEGCTLIRELPNPCIDNCPIITDFNYGAGACRSDGSFVLEFVMASDADSNRLFDVVIGDVHYGTYHYGAAQYRLEVFNPTCDSIILTIIDHLHQDCKYEFPLNDVPCCECLLEAISITPICFENQHIGFEIKTPQIPSSLSSVSGRVGDISFGPIPYDTTITLTYSNGSPIYEFVVVDSLTECELVIEVAVDCMEELPCSIDELEVEAINCTEEDFQFRINFTHDRPALDLFDIIINGTVVGTSTYSLLPANTSKLLRSDGGPWTVTIRDKALDSCAIHLTIDEEMCEVNTADTDLDVKILVSEYQLYIYNKANTMDRLSIVDVLGREIYHYQGINGQLLSLTLPSSMSGLYWVKWMDRQGGSHSQNIYIR